MTSEANGGHRQAQLRDEAILERLKAGDTRGFEVIVRRNDRWLSRAIRAILRHDADVEDVLQEAYVLAFTHLGAFRGEARLSTWLTRIAVRLAFAHARRSRRFAQLQTEVDVDGPINPTSASPERSMSDTELGSALQRAVEALPDALGSVFMLRAIEERGVAEVSELLAIPEATVKTRHFRARDFLKHFVLRAEDASSSALGGTGAPGGLGGAHQTMARGGDASSRRTEREGHG